MEIITIKRIEDINKKDLCPGRYLAQSYNSGYYEIKNSKEYIPGEYKYFWEIPLVSKKGIVKSKRHRPEIMEILGQLEFTNYVLCSNEKDFCSSSSVILTLKNCTFYI